VSYTFEQFEKTYAEVRPPEVPEDFEAQLASKVSRDLRNYILEPQRKPLPYLLNPGSLRVWKNI